MKHIFHDSNFKFIHSICIIRKKQWYMLFTFRFKKTERAVFYWEPFIQREYYCQRFLHFLLSLSFLHGDKIGMLYSHLDIVCFFMMVKLPKWWGNKKKKFYYDAFNLCYACKEAGEMVNTSFTVNANKFIWFWTVALIAYSSEHFVANGTSHMCNVCNV